MKSPALNWIDGKFVGSPDVRTSINPATYDVIGTYVDAGLEAAQRSVEAAKRALADRNNRSAKAVAVGQPSTTYLTTETLDRALAFAEPMTRAGLYLSLAIIYFWFGGMKFTAYEASGLVPLVSNNPMVGWFYDLLSVRVFSAFLGVVELSIGLLVLLGLFNPARSALGGLLSAGLFVTTLSFMATTPGTFEPSLGFPAISVAPGQFLLKDIGLLAVSLWIFVDSARRLRRA